MTSRSTDPREAAPPQEDVALSQTVAILTASPGPLLLLDGQLNLLALSASFRTAFGLDLSDVVGRSFFSLGDGEWNLPRLRNLLEATAAAEVSIEAYEMVLERAGREPRHLIIQARRLDYLDLEQVRVLVAVADVTETRADARLKDEALAQNRILLREVQHRVANSLQIIAAVLLQNARTTVSDETRRHLR